MLCLVKISLHIVLPSYLHYQMHFFLAIFWHNMCTSLKTVHVGGKKAKQINLLENCRHLVFSKLSLVVHSRTLQYSRTDRWQPESITLMSYIVGSPTQKAKQANCWEKDDMNVVVFVIKLFMFSFQNSFCSLMAKTLYRFEAHLKSPKLYFHAKVKWNRFLEGNWSRNIYFVEELAGKMHVILN